MAEGPWRSSIAGRLAMALVVIFAGGGLAVVLAALAYGRAAADRSYDRLLIGAADQISGAVGLRLGRIDVDVPVSAFQLLALAPDDRIAYAVLGPDGALVTGYPDLPVSRRSGVFVNGDLEGEPARFVTVVHRFAERAFIGDVTVIVGQTTNARLDLAHEITRAALVLAGAVGLLMSMLAIFAVRTALRPLERIEAGLAGRAPQDLTPIAIAVPQEVSRLVGALNGFMTRIERQIAALSSLIGDASHQLRTPVAALRAQAELARDEDDPDSLRRLVGGIHSRAVNLTRLTDQLLSRAMVIHRADSAPLAALDLRRAAIEAVAEADRDHAGGTAALALDLSEDAVEVRGDMLSLVEATKNLIGNALRYGAAPVTVRVAVEDGQAVLAVQDRGPGIPESAWSDAARRYSRDSGISATSAGLGLAIVDAVAVAHRGALRFRRTTADAFEAALVMPLGESER
jgi:two-component system sensor histidine kinase TctE